jgi:hypothetical protein
MEFTDEEIRNILRRHRKKQRREIFKWIGWFKKNYMRKTAPNNPSNPPLLAQCGAPAFRGRGDVSDSSLLPRRVGAANDLSRKAMPVKDAGTMGQTDYLPPANGAETPDGYQNNFDTMHQGNTWPGVTPANTLEVSRDGNPILQKEIGPNLEIKDTLSPSIKLRI